MTLFFLSHDGLQIVYKVRKRVRGSVRTNAPSPPRREHLEEEEVVVVAVVVVAAAAAVVWTQ
jgi:hypothetical protein